MVGFFTCQVFCGCLCRSSSNSPQCTSPSQLPFFSVELLGGGITIVDHPLLCFLPLHYNIAVMVAAMLLLSFLSDRRFLSLLLYSFIFFEISTPDLGVAAMPTPVFCQLLSSYLHAIALIVLLLFPFSCAALYSLTLIAFFYCVDRAEMKDTTTTIIYRGMVYAKICHKKDGVAFREDGIPPQLQYRSLRWRHCVRFDRVWQRTPDRPALAPIAVTLPTKLTSRYTTNLAKRCVSIRGTVMSVLRSLSLAHDTALC